MGCCALTCPPLPAALLSMLIYNFISRFWCNPANS